MAESVGDQWPEGRRRIEIARMPGRTLSIVQYGPENVEESSRVILYVHGAGGRAGQWKLTLGHLLGFDPRARHVLINLYGHGDSGKDDDASLYAFPELIDDVCFFFNLFKHPKPGRTFIVAHSMGTSLSVHALDLLFNRASEAEQAGINRGHVGGLVLVGTTSDLDSSPKSAVFSLPCFILEWMRPLLASGFAKLAHHDAQHPELQVEGAIAEANPNPFHVMKPLIHSLVWPSLALFEAVQPLPLLIVAGQSDQLTTAAGATRIYEHLRQAAGEADALPLSLTILENTGHLIMLEGAQPFNDLVASFLFPPT